MTASAPIAPIASLNSYYLWDLLRAADDWMPWADVPETVWTVERTSGYLNSLLFGCPPPAIVLASLEHHSTVIDGRAQLDALRGALMPSVGTCWQLRPDGSVTAEIDRQPGTVLLSDLLDTFHYLAAHDETDGAMQETMRRAALNLQHTSVVVHRFGGIDEQEAHRIRAGLHWWTPEASA